MKFLNLRDAKATLSAAIATSQQQRVVITKHGKPVCIIIGCEGYEIEDVLTAADPGFWEDDRRTPIKRTRPLACVGSRALRQKRCGNGEAAPIPAARVKEVEIASARRSS